MTLFNKIFVVNFSIAKLDRSHTSEPSQRRCSTPQQSSSSEAFRNEYRRQNEESGMSSSKKLKTEETSSVSEDLWEKAMKENVCSNLFSNLFGV